MRREQERVNKACLALGLDSGDEAVENSVVGTGDNLEEEFFVRDCLLGVRL